MSEENEQGEEKPKDDLAGLDEFEFYFSFTKPLVLDLPSSEDRAIAAAWVQKLEAEPESEEEKQLRLNYLKLLLFVLQRGRLSGIFKKQPPSGPLQPFPQGFSIIDMGNWMLDQDDGTPCGGGDARGAPYTIEISNDLREFVASQEIPNFGIQMYYAWSSDDPIHKWASFDEEKFPQFILDKIKQLKEIKSDERSSIGKNGCPVKKKGCDLNLQDKYSKKKVKSPQEIERSQGRSFHTYMGLVGRMGNFNDKCDDDPDKFQRQDPRKMKCPRRSSQKRCPTNGGEDDMMAEEDFDNLVSGLGGLSAQAKSCQCAYPAQSDICPDHNPKGGPQAFDPQQSPGRNGYSMRGDVDPSSCPPGVPKPPSPRRQIEDLCPEFQNQIGPQQRNACRSRSGSPNRPAECPPEDKARGFPEQTGVCICSTPPCTCPCPRGNSPKATSNANAAGAGGRASPETTRCPVKSPKQDLCGPEGYGSRGGPNYNSPSRAQDSCPPMGSPEGYGNRSAPNYISPSRAQDSCPPMGSPEGCGNRSAPNYISPSRAQDSCLPMGSPEGCGNRSAPNYISPSRAQDSCPPIGSPEGCGNRSAQNYNSPSRAQDSCPPMGGSEGYGNRSAPNYNSPSRAQDSCPPMGGSEVYGNRSAPNYNSPSRAQDSCPPMGGSEAYGNRSAPNYNASNRTQDSCAPVGSSEGCGNRSAPNYNTPNRAQDSCPPMGGPEAYGNRSAPNYNTPNRAQDSCVPMGSPSGATARQGSPNARPGQTEVLHCFDPRNPDPALYDKMDKGWVDAARDRGNKRLEEDFQNFMSREQSPVQNMNMSRRGLFMPLAQSTPIAQEPCGVPSDIPRHAGRYCPPQARVTSPPIGQQRQCDYSAQDDQNASYQSGILQMTFRNQPGFMDFGSEPPSPIAPSECYGQRPKQDACRKSPSQAIPKPKAFAGAQGGNDSGRMANMANVLQGMKQRTEAHREKCEAGATRRSPSNDASYYTGNAQGQAKSNRETGAMAQGGNCQPRNARQGQVLYSRQEKQPQQCGPSQERGYVNLPSSPQMKQVMPQQQQQPAHQRQQMRAPTASPMGPDCYPNNQPGFQNFEFQEDDICEADIAAYDSLEACRPPSPLGAPQQNMARGMQQCMPQGMSQGMQQGMPQGMQQGMPQGMQQGMPQGMQQCAPQGMQQGMSQGMQQGMPQGMQQCMPQGMQQSAPIVPMDECRSMAPLSFSPTPDDNNGPQWIPMKAVMQDQFRSPLSRPYQGELGDVEGRCTRPSRGQLQSGSPSRNAPSTRTSPSPPRTSPGRTSPPRNGSPRNGPGANNAQDASQCSATPESSGPWSTKTQPAGSRSPTDFEEVNWVSPPQAIPNDNFMRMDCPDPRSRDVQIAPCAPPPSPAPNMACNRQTSPQQRSSPNYPNYPQQAMNAEPQFQEDQCVDDMVEDMGNMDMNDMECSDQQAYAYQDDMCEDDGEGAYGEEDNDACDVQNFMPMKPNGEEECYDDYQDMNDCDPMPPPQNSPMNRSGGGQRNSASQGQGSCNRPPPMNNRNPSPPNQCPGGITTIHRR